jgi:hypothetical protein
LQDSEADALAELTEGAVGADRTIVQYSLTALTVVNFSKIF